jgi:hypothetical protein
MGSLDVAPSEVQPSTDAGGDEVDLFDRALPDVGDPQVVRGPVEGEPPRVPQPVLPDLGRAVDAVGEGIVGRDRIRTAVGARVRRVDAGDVAEQDLRVLARPMGIASAAAVAQYRKPSASTTSPPPLWLGAKSGMVSSVRRFVASA